MPYLTTANYPAIRAALDITLGADRLPDDVIASAAFHPAAEAEVARRLGTLAAAAEGQAGAIRATILLTAARLLPALPNITQRALTDTRITLAPMAQDARVRQWRAEASREISALRVLLDPTATDALAGPATVFTVAPGGRAQSRNVAEGTEVPGGG